MDLGSDMISPENTRGKLSVEQIRNFRRQGITQIITCGFMFIILSYAGFRGLFQFSEQFIFNNTDMPYIIVVLLAAAFLLMIFFGLASGILTFSGILFTIMLPNIEVACCEGDAYIETKIYPRYAKLDGQRPHPLAYRISLVHGDKWYTVPQELLKNIPHQGRFRFFYLNYRGKLEMFVPRHIVGMEHINEVASEEMK